MKAVAIAMLSYCRVFPIQRWVGVGTLTLAALVAALRSENAVAFLVIAMACLMFAVLGPLGFLFREISAVRSHGLLPYFRARMLIAVVLVVAFFPSVGYLLLQFAPRGAPPAAPWFAIAILFASAWLWFTFFLPASLWAALFAVPVGALLRSTGGENPYLPAIAVALGAGWIAFILWYLRARTIPSAAPLRTWAQRLPLNWLQRLDARLSDRSGTFVPGSAIEGGLTGRYPLRAKDRLASAAFLVLILSLAWGWALRGAGFDRPDLLIATSCFAILPVLFAVANNAARRARCLWLHAGRTRRELFGAVERNLWGGPLFIWGVGLVGFAGVARLAFAVDVLWQAIPALIATSILAAYLGLGCVRRVVLVSWLSAPLIVILGFTALHALVSGNVRVFAGVVALEVVLALAGRAIAIRLWERIDWIALRPLRMPIVLGRFTR